MGNTKTTARWVWSTDYSLLTPAMEVKFQNIEELKKIYQKKAHTKRNGTKSLKYCKENNFEPRILFLLKCES